MSAMDTIKNQLQLFLYGKYSGPPKKLILFDNMAKDMVCFRHLGIFYKGKLDHVYYHTSLSNNS